MALSIEGVRGYAVYGQLKLVSNKPFYFNQIIIGQCDT